MDILYKSKRLEKLFNSKRDLEREYGLECAKKIILRQSQMRSAANLAEFALVHPRCHHLSGSLKEFLAVDLKHPLRLLMQPYDDPLPVKNDGGLDWTNVCSVLIVRTEDYHG